MLQKRLGRSSSGFIVRQGQHMTHGDVFLPAGAWMMQTELTDAGGNCFGKLPHFVGIRGVREDDEAVTVGGIDTGGDVARPAQAPGVAPSFL